MTTYKGIKGFSVKFVSADPPVAQEGEVFYNSTTEKLKVFTAQAGSSSWASGPSLATAVNQARGTGTATGGFIFGGGTSAQPGGSNQSQTWSGSAWANAPTMPYQATALFGNNDSGGASSSLAAGGRNGPGSGEGLTSTASWNGSAWSSEATMPDGRRYGFSAGTGENIIASGGLAASPPTGFPGASNTYNGTAWASAPALNTNRSNGGSGGTFPSGIAFAGCSPPYCASINTTETWNGTSWSTSPGNFPTTSAPSPVSFAGAGMPSGNNGIYVDGTDAFNWNGSSWSAGTAKSGSKTSGSHSGTPTSAFYAGGSPDTTDVELWTTTAPSIVAKDISLD
jgi:hypothetical protein